MYRPVLIGGIILFAGVVAGIAFGLPRPEAVRALGWIAKAGAAVGMLGLLASMVFSALERSRRSTEVCRQMLQRIADYTVQAIGAGFSAFIGAAGAKLIIEGNVILGCVMFGAYAVIVFIVIVAPKEV